MSIPSLYPYYSRSNNPSKLGSSFCRILYFICDDLKYHLSDTFRRHIHLKLCSISRELNMIFGLQMMMQVIAFHIFTVQIIYQCYVTMIADFTHEKLLNLLSIYFWIIIIIIKMIILNYICERICNKV